MLSCGFRPFFLFGAPCRAVDDLVVAGIHALGAAAMDIGMNSALLLQDLISFLGLQFCDGRPSFHFQLENNHRHNDLKPLSLVGSTVSLTSLKPR